MAQQQLLVVLYCSLKINEIRFNNNTKILLSKELSKLLDISMTTVYRIIDSREITFYKIKGSIRFLEADILDYIEKKRIESI